MYGSIDAKLWLKIVITQFSGLFIKHLLIYFNAEKIILIGLTLNTNLTDAITVIPMTEVSELSFKSGFIRGKLTFKFKQKKYLIKVPNFILVAKWQKRNLKNILQRYIIKYS